VSSLCFTLAILLAGLLYLHGWLRLRSTCNPITSWRAASFFLGLLLIWVAAGSPIASFDRAMLTGHMIQHLMLMTLGPPLMWLGMAPNVTLYGGYRPSRPLCWLCATATLIIWHIPAAFTLGMRSEVWHAVEQISFLGTGLLFWWPVIEPWPGVNGWTTIVYLFLATLPCDFLSGFLVFSDHIAYHIYVSTPDSCSVSVLADQQSAGALMWTCVTLVYLVAGAILTMHLLRHPSSS
jgi:cytochrome c oxidase assembly factor CtaG